MEPEKKYNPLADVEFVANNYFTFNSPKDLIDFERLYLDADEEGFLSFRFQGKLVLTDFAKHIIQYVHSQPSFRDVKLLKF